MSNIEDNMPTGETMKTFVVEDEPTDNTEAKPLKKAEKEETLVEIKEDLIISVEIATEGIQKEESVNTIYHKIYNTLKKTVKYSVIIGIIYIIQEFVRAYYNQDYTRLGNAYFKALAIKSGLVSHLNKKDAMKIVLFLKETFFKYAEIFAEALTTGVKKVKTLF